MESFNLLRKILKKNPLSLNSYSIFILLCPQVLFVPGKSFMPGGRELPSPYVRASYSIASPENIDTVGLYFLCLTSTKPMNFNYIHVSCALGLMTISDCI